MIKQFTKKDKALKHVVSYSQFSLWNECPYKWYLNYPMRYRAYEPNINLLFGNSMHETLQFYVKAIYEKSVKYADSFNLNELLYHRMVENYKIYLDELKQLKAKEQVYSGLGIEAKDVSNLPLDVKKGFYNRVNELTPTMEATSDEVTITQEDMQEYYTDGVKILTWFKKHRSDYFNSKKYKLIGIEMPLELWLLEGVKFQAFLDIVLQDIESGNIIIIDLKTSKKTWSSWQKSDENKTMQLVLYKTFYSQLFNVPPEMITVQFIILKRKIYEQSEFPQKRFQRIVPASGKPTMNKVSKKLENFLENCFTKDGDYNYDGFFPKIPTDSNCRFCAFNDQPELCDKKN